MYSNNYENIRRAMGTQLNSSTNKVNPTSLLDNNLFVELHTKIVLFFVHTIVLRVVKNTPHYS